MTCYDEVARVFSSVESLVVLAWIEKALKVAERTMHDMRAKMQLS